jgi:phosphatidylglycerophosphatase A
MNADRWAARAVATWFGCGYWPWGPGTAGSAAAVLIACAMQWSPMQTGLAGLIVLLPAVWASGAEAAHSGRKDPGHIVVDEVAGQWIALAGTSSVNWKSALAAFVLFRLFDIWKPMPARQLERLPGGFGIMADDVMAGLYGALVLYALGLLNLY